MCRRVRCELSAAAERAIHVVELDGATRGTIARRPISDDMTTTSAEEILVQEFGVAGEVTEGEFFAGLGAGAEATELVQQLPLAYGGRIVGAMKGTEDRDEAYVRWLPPTLVQILHKLAPRAARYPLDKSARGARAPPSIR